jgi:DNA-binding beta-propeller fold protein YncE
MTILVTSASGANGDGYGAVLSFDGDGSLAGPFSEDRRIVDPRGMSPDPTGTLVYVNSGDDRILALDQSGAVALDSGRLDRLDPGGGNFGPDGRYYITLRKRRTIVAFPAGLEGDGEAILPDGVVAFPRGFGFGREGELYLSSGVGPTGDGDNTIALFDPTGTSRNPRFVDDPELSPLDLSVGPNGNIVVSSEWPFGAAGAAATVREYDSSTGRLVRVLSPDPALGFARPRGLRFGPDDQLYCVGRDHVIVFDFVTGSFLDAVVSLPRLNGQAVLVLAQGSAVFGHFG